MIDVKIKSGVCARFRLTTRKNGVKTKETDWFNNLVLDSGLARMRHGNATEFLAVGTSNAEPAVDQLGLGDLIAFTSSVIKVGDGISTASNGKKYIWAKYKYTFATGTATGNIAEIGLGWLNTTTQSRNNMFNRALVRDNLGNPVVITVLSDESLEVEVELQHHPAQDEAGSFNLTNGDIVTSHSVNAGFLNSYISSSPPIVGGVFVTSNYAEIAVFAGGMPSTPSIEPDRPHYVAPGGLQRQLIYPTNLSMLYSPTFTASQAAQSHRTLIINISGLIGNHRLALEITPAISKPNTHKLTYNILFEWGRYEPA